MIQINMSACDYNNQGVAEWLKEYIQTLKKCNTLAKLVLFWSLNKENGFIYPQSGFVAFSGSSSSDPRGSAPTENKQHVITSMSGSFE